MDPHSLIDLLRRSGALDEAEAVRLSAVSDSGEDDIFAVLEASGYGSRIEILKSVASFQGLEFVDLRSSAVPPQLLTELPQDIMRIYRCFPMQVSVDLCKVCMVDPLDDSACSELSRLLGKPVEVVIADPDLVDAVVRSALSGDFESSPLVGAAATAPVAASLGSVRAEEPGSDDAATGTKDFRLLWSFSLLAVAAVGLVALYLGQKKTMALSHETRAGIEESNKSIEHAGLAVRKEILQIEEQLQQLKQLLEKNEVDAITLQQLKEDVRQIEVKFENIEKIKSPTDVAAPESDDSDVPAR